MQVFTLVFLTALVISSVTRLWLSSRHLRHVARNRESVPQEFSGRITLASHQKAADYTGAKTRLCMLETFVGGLIPFGPTPGAGFQGLA